jgi:hypothetical protein
MAIARDQLLAKGYGTPRRLVVNYDLHDKESTRTVVEGEWLVTYRLKWQEFQAVSAEATADGFALFYNDFCRYSAGDPGTSLGVWQFCGRFQGQKILEENIDA